MSNPYEEYIEKWEQMFENWEGIKGCGKEELATAVAENLPDIKNIRPYMPMILDAVAQTFIDVLLRDGELRIMGLGRFNIGKHKSARFKEPNSELKEKYYRRDEEGYYWSPPGFSIKFTPSTRLREALKVELYGRESRFAHNKYKGRLYTQKPLHPIMDKEDIWYNRIKQLLEYKKKTGEYIAWTIFWRNANPINRREPMSVAEVGWKTRKTRRFKEELRQKKEEARGRTLDL